MNIDKTLKHYIHITNQISSIINVDCRLSSRSRVIFRRGYISTIKITCIFEFKFYDSNHDF